MRECTRKETLSTLYLCMTMSQPSDSGRMKYGDLRCRVDQRSHWQQTHKTYTYKNVLSAATRICVPCCAAKACAASATARTSVTFNVGFVGDSIWFAYQVSGRDKRHERIANPDETSVRVEHGCQLVRVCQIDKVELDAIQVCTSSSEQAPRATVDLAMSVRRGRGN